MGKGNIFRMSVNKHHMPEKFNTHSFIDSRLVCYQWITPWNKALTEFSHYYEVLAGRLHNNKF